MLPNWLRSLILVLLLVLITNVLINLPKKFVKENPNLKVVLLEPNKTYKCLVERLNNCSLKCVLTTTAVSVLLKPDNCGATKNLKRNQTVIFRVLNEPYYPDGSVPVEILGIQPSRR